MIQSPPKRIILESIFIIYIIYYSRCWLCVDCCSFHVSLIIGYYLLSIIDYNSWLVFWLLIPFFGPQTSRSCWRCRPKPRDEMRTSQVHQGGNPWFQGHGFGGNPPDVGGLNYHRFQDSFSSGSSTFLVTKLVVNHVNTPMSFIETVPALEVVVRHLFVHQLFPSKFCGLLQFYSCCNEYTASEHQYVT